MITLIKEYWFGIVFAFAMVFLLGITLLQIATGFPSVSTPLITYVIMNECVGFVGPMILRQELLIPATTTPEDMMKIKAKTNESCAKAEVRRDDYIEREDNFRHEWCREHDLTSLSYNDAVMCRTTNLTNNI